MIRIWYFNQLTLSDGDKQDPDKQKHFPSILLEKLVSKISITTGKWCKIHHTLEVSGVERFFIVKNYNLKGNCISESYSTFKFRLETLHVEKE